MNIKWIAAVMVLPIIGAWAYATYNIINDDYPVQNIDRLWLAKVDLASGKSEDVAAACKKLQDLKAMKKLIKEDDRDAAMKFFNAKYETQDRGAVSNLTIMSIAKKTMSYSCARQQGDFLCYWMADRDFNERQYQAP